VQTGNDQTNEISGDNGQENRLIGQGGDDRLSGSRGADWLEGGAGNDTLTVGPGLTAAGTTFAREGMCCVLPFAFSIRLSIGLISRREKAKTRPYPHMFYCLKTL
jgi:hypothetical protein